VKGGVFVAGLGGAGVGIGGNWAFIIFLVLILLVFGMDFLA
jgi:hypothetical protein